MIGGIGTVWGPVIGAAVVGPLSELIAEPAAQPAVVPGLPAGLTGLDVACTPSLLIAIVLFMPKGIYGTLRDRWRR